MKRKLIGAIAMTVVLTAVGCGESPTAARPGGTAVHATAAKPGTTTITATSSVTNPNDGEVCWGYENGGSTGSGTRTLVIVPCPGV